MTRAGVAAGAALCAALFAATARIGAQSAGDWRHWQYAATINLPADTAAPLAAIVMTPEIARHTQRDWADLRIVDDQGRETPFVIRERHAERRWDPRAGRILDRGSVPGRYSQFVVDLGAGAPIHNRTKFALSGSDDFATWVEIAASADAKTWAIVRDRAPIYRLPRAGLGEWMEASYPDSTARYVRVRILDGAHRYDVVTAAVMHEVATTTELAPAPVTFVAAPAARDRSVYVSSPVTPGLNVGELRSRRRMSSSIAPCLLRPVMTASTGREPCRAPSRAHRRAT